MVDPRTAAARVLAQVLAQGRSLAAALPPALAAIPGDRDRALVQALAYGVLRWHPRLEALLQALLKHPLRPKETEVRALLLVGLYQILYMEMPPHAAVSSAVSAARGLGRPWSAGLINGVLRNLLRDAPRWLAKADRDLAARLAHPAWLLERLQAAWPEHWQAVAAANNRQPPMSLRVNPRHLSRNDYRERLRQAGLEARPTAHAPQGLVLARAVDVAQLPGFTEGWVSVQDEAAQLAAPLLAVEPGQRVLDACAAPGGKTAHLLELTDDIELLALDADGQRLQRVREGLDRLGLSATLRCADASRAEDWWDGRPFHRILLDAPCTATGVIRRHPDIKVLRRAEDLPAMAQRQTALLESLWPLLAEGGKLLYATCSILPPENQDLIDAFLMRHRDARLHHIPGQWGQDTGAGRQILPGEDDMDGFFYALLARD